MIQNHLIQHSASIKDALIKLNGLGLDAILFVIDENERLIGSLTDGDVRRGLIRNLSLEDKVSIYIQPNPKYLYKSNYKFSDVLNFKKNNYKIIPIVDDAKRIVNIVNFRLTKSYLPVDAVLMAGGKGERLRPLTEKTPKPLLMIGDKPIIAHNLENLIKYGIDDFHITLGYLGDQIKDYLNHKEEWHININFVTEDIPLGTAGSLSLITQFSHDYVLLTNSDILTTLDYEDFFSDFINEDADLSAFTIPYTVNIPLGVFEIQQENIIKSVQEKPSYTYYANSGIYLLKKELIDLIPKEKFYNAPDFLEALIKNKKKVVSYNSSAYWLDIGTPNDFEKAQKDILHLKF